MCGVARPFFAKQVTALQGDGHFFRRLDIFWLAVGNSVPQMAVYKEK